jgi:hypothetical protein
LGEGNRLRLDGERGHSSQRGAIEPEGGAALMPQEETFEREEHRQMFPEDEPTYHEYLDGYVDQQLIRDQFKPWRCSLCLTRLSDRHCDCGGKVERVA